MKTGSIGLNLATAYATATSTPANPHMPGRVEEKDLKGKLRELHKKRITQQREYDDLQKFCEKFKTDSKLTPKIFVKRYLNSLKNASDEMSSAQICLEGLVRYVQGRISKIHQENADIWIHDHTTILKNGSKVAANTSENLWVLAMVDRYIPQRGRYHVIDADAQQSVESRKHYKLEPSKLIPLPSLDQYPITKRRIFKPNEWVFAMYPGTTAFYRAKVLSSPNSKDSPPRYTLEFEDDGNKKIHVGIEKVAPLPRPSPSN
ncbi:hypothetical protein AAMO2058_000318500 [Amorphochlora amoebiformis]